MKPSVMTPIAKANRFIVNSLYAAEGDNAATRLMVSWIVTKMTNSFLLVNTARARSRASGQFDRAHSMIVVRQWIRRSFDGYPPAAELTVQRLSQHTMLPAFHLCRYSAFGCSMYQ